jgi:hypothetical protein
MSERPKSAVWGKAEIYIALHSAMLDSTTRTQPELGVDVAVVIAKERRTRDIEEERMTRPFVPLVYTQLPFSVC